MSRPNPIFAQALGHLNDRQREHIEAAFALLEHSIEPVHRQYLPAMEDASSRTSLEDLLRRTGRTLVTVDGGLHWTSGFDDTIAAGLTAAGWQPLTTLERAVLTLVLVHSVAIPRSEEQLNNDTWASSHPTAAAEILRHSKLPSTEARLALSRLAAVGLIRMVRSGDSEGGYVPGPQLQRLTPAARERLQEQLILAAAPDHPLASAIRERRSQHPKGQPL
ncbi:hypothetical protein QEZ54_20500 [Catellatospora sp. KI3]|uniref:hypothetical protein n=1 Tax=Catellatospora sp. KI3 TaxID=3041620 RepID=UPI002482E4A6|nr:hypothetical protein [Catellatospora sp. KI3]MDI1463367.1 hypothetical protein [Catellatospora sp. KI3]